MPRHVLRATLLAGVLHGFLVLAGVYRLSFDAYTHMFFADHYRLAWWSLWEPRWYTGFEVISYPPLVHQLIGLLGHLIGVDAGYGLISWVVLTAYPVAIYLFCRIFTGRAAAGYAAYGGALLPAVYLSAYIFGQLPTLTGALLTLFAAAVLADFLRKGDLLTAACAIGLTVCVAAAHHASVLFLPGLFGAVFVRVALEGHIQFRKSLVRLTAFGILAALSSGLVILPFWQWGLHQAIQTPIDHLTRHNYFREQSALVMFFLPVYGLFILLVPAATFLARRKEFWGPMATFIVLFLLGLGGTTPLPRLLFGAGWSWLTYDRFALWASLILLVFLGNTIIPLRRWLRQRWHPHIWPSRKQLRQAPGWIAIGILTTQVLLISRMPAWLPTQPPVLNMQPIVDFLAEDGHAQWHYLTFGFGDQLAKLSRLTKATTTDGSYHTARLLPELRTSGIGQIDTAYWIPDGLQRLDRILEQSASRGVRWGFVNLVAYTPVLVRNGWHQLETLSNGVQVWEDPASILPSANEPPSHSPVATFAWGTFPLLTLVLSGGLVLRRYLPTVSKQVLPAVQALVLGLLPLSLTFWYYTHLISIPHDRIYFTYSDILFFLSDGLALVTVLIWASKLLPARAGNPMQATKTKLLSLFSRLDTWLFVLCVLATLSSLWSREWRTSLYISLHWWLAFGLFLAIRSQRQAWHWLALGCAAALSVQVVVGVWQFIAQSTSFLTALRLEWPGDIVPAIHGASVVELADGTRWLRAYGTMAHPNLLGGFTLFMLASLLPVIITSTRWRILAGGLFQVGLVLLILTFSRSAWLGLVATILTGLLLLRGTNRKLLLKLTLVSLVTLTVMIVLLHPLFLTRLGASDVQTEQVSSYTRLWLLQNTIELIEQQPMLGVGVGAYSLALSQNVARFFQIEPVHNIPLLMVSELGLSGALLSLWLGIILLRQPWKLVGKTGSLNYALVIGLVTVSLFDHYLWTLAPGRLLFGISLGLLANQELSHDG